MKFDETAFRASMGDDPYLMSDIVRLSLEDLPEQKSRLQELLASKDWEQISRSAHAIKGVALSLSASELAQMALQLEETARSGSDTTPALVQSVSDSVESLTEVLTEFLNRIDSEMVV